MPPPPLPGRQPSFSSERPAALTAPPPPRPTAAAQAAIDNRSVQLNPQHATYYQSRGAGPAEAAQAALAAAKAHPLDRSHSSH